MAGWLGGDGLALLTGLAQRGRADRPTAVGAAAILLLLLLLLLVVVGLLISLPARPPADWPGYLPWGWVAVTVQDPSVRQRPCGVCATRGAGCPRRCSSISAVWLFRESRATVAPHGRFAPVGWEL